MRVQFICLFLLLLLAGCGGEGGGGSTTPPTGGGGGGGESLASQEIPDLFQFSFAEDEGGFVTRDADPFLFTAPSDNVTVTFVLEGTDAQYFNLVIEIPPPNAAGQRELVVSATKLAELDFEAPLDADADNTYEFDLVVTYQGEEIRSRIEVQITDVDDGGIATARLFLVGETNDLSFGLRNEVFPDLDGDGLQELGVSISGFENVPSAAYIFTGAFLGRENGDIRLPTSGDFGIRLLEDGASGVRNYNRVSSLTRPDGNGSDMLISASANQSFSLFQITQPSDFNGLLGNLSVTAIPDAVVYQYSGVPLIARLIGDFNGDGENDIFVHEASLIDGPIEMGIIFGDPSLPAGPRQMQFDVSMRAPERFLFDEGNPSNPPDAQTVDARIDALLLPDADGDDFAELLVCTYLRPTSNDTLSRNFYIRGGNPDLVSGTSVDLETLDPADGFEFPQECYGAALASDLDGDGSPTVVIGDSFVEPERFLSPPADVNLTAFDLFVSGSGMFVDIGDIDGDGVSDFFSPGRASPNPRGGIWLGSTVAAAISGPDPLLQIIDPDIVLDLQDLGGFARAENAEPVYLDSLEAIVIGYTQSPSQQEPFPGYLVVLDRAELAAGLDVTPRFLEVRR